MSPLLVEAERVVALAADRAIADTTLNTTLGLGGRVYRDVAPNQAASPFATISVLASVDLTTLEGAHVWSDCQYLWKVSNVDGTYAALLPLAERLGALFDGWTASASGVQVIRWRRIGSPHEPPEVLPGGQVARVINQLFSSESYSLT